VSHRSLHIRVAAAWLRRARQSPDGGRFQQFLDEMGDTKVRTPGRSAPVQINTLQSSDKPEDRIRVQEEYQKWSAGGDDDARQPIGTPAKLKATQDELVQFAVEDGLSRSEARELVRGLTVKNTVADVQQVERNIAYAVEQSRKKREKADADAKLERDKADAEAQTVRDARNALLRLHDEQAQLVADAVKAGVPEEDARALMRDLELGDEADVLDEVREALEDKTRQVRRDQRRQSIRDTAAAASQGVADAERALTNARKSKDKDRIADAEEALRAAEEALYWSQADRDSVDRDVLQEQGARLDREAAAARAEAQARHADVDDLQARIADAAADGDDTLAATLTADLVAAQEALGAADRESREASKRAETHALATRRRFAEMSRAEFDRTWARAKRNPGVLLYNADGKAERYDPSTTDAAYDVFMTLLGEQLDRREIPDMSKADTSVESQDEDAGPTYDPGDVWEVDGGWSAKNSKRKTREFDTIDSARAFAKTARGRR
jgi:hypothetical protein